MPLKCHHLGMALVLLIAGTASPPANGKGPEDPLPPANLAGVRGAAQLLAQELDNAEQYIVLSLRSGKDERTFYKQADAALGQVRKFNKDLTDKTARKQLYKEFDQLNDKLDKLLNHVKDRFALDAPLRLIANRIRAAREEVRYNLLLGDTDEGRSRELLQSQIGALLAAVENLNATGQYALSSDPDQAELLVNMKAFLQATQKFQLAMANGAKGAELRRSFEIVFSTWDKVVTGMTMVSATENASLARSTLRTDTAFERVHRLLEYGGKRPRYQIPD
jgi:hypothetical protein